MLTVRYCLDFSCLTTSLWDNRTTHCVMAFNDPGISSFQPEIAKAGTKKKAAISAAPIVPENIQSNAKFGPSFIPEITRSGGSSRINPPNESSTQSAG